MLSWDKFFTLSLFVNRLFTYPTTVGRNVCKWTLRDRSTKHDAQYKRWWEWDQLSFLRGSPSILVGPGSFCGIMYEPSIMDKGQIKYNCVKVILILNLIASINYMCF